MMKIAIICVGKTKDKYLVEGMYEFEKRLSAFCDLKMVYLADASGTSEKVIEKESQTILDNLKKFVGYKIITLDVGGKAFSSENFAQYVGVNKDFGEKLLFLIGGAFGYSDEVRKLAHLRMSISPMTFTHQMIRLILLEQIYRAFTIINGKVYHH